MTAAYQKFLRVVTGALGLAGVAAIALLIYELVFSFTVWRLSLCLLSIPGAAVFLWYAFHREHRWTFGLGGTSGPASAVVPWPRPSKPPSFSVGAVASLPEDAESIECQSTAMPNKSD